MTAALMTPPKSLVPDRHGLVRLDRGCCFDRIMQALDAEVPTKAATLHATLGFSEQAVRDSLGVLLAHGFVERTSVGYYVRRWAPLWEVPCA